ncbi:FtsX-like permease family protein [Subtercola boreus]|uniref:ABC3 transporter permease C-terminal domain-containing protein n=1 Tax=Subtercola boreus TaxID=120213 RepID=A0A3E0WBV8_9MICO|nr:FtsX-like permease family protein [Subtercola boreus]RFA21071.1 hypothetical protein B7R24_06605 [Subtercola boreus]RFA21455.1 hypothetical protein B7R23_06550 [Subtercola boreus]RFA27426.1 hypothetical protein B7R25_06675 [Subtercola boreus]
MAVVVVRAASPTLVGAVAAVVSSVLGVDDPTTVTVQTSEQLASVRQQVAGQLGDYGRTLVLSVFGAAAALVGAILLALVMLRRRDFGRRRALGASRSILVALLLSQVGLLAAVAVLVGVTAALLLLGVQGLPLPTPAFTIAVGVLAIVTSLVAAVVPALIASTRDPLRELRVA